MTAMNKRLLISESRGDSNRCTSCRGKTRPTRHVRFPRQSTYARCTLRVGSPRMWQLLVRRWQIWIDPTTPEKKGSRHNPQHVGWPIRGSIPSFSPELANKAGGCKPSSWRWPTTRFTGPISPACDRYVQYLLMWANRTILNRHRWGLQPWRCRLSIYHSPTFLASYLPFPLKAPPGLRLSKQHLPI
jgi:hypothetical protein